MKRDAESRTQVALSAEPAGAPRTRTSVDDRIVIRPFEPDDAAAVRALFITVNRLMAPLHLAVRFDAYIARALREEIDTIASYFAARGGQFFVATAAGELVGMFGFEMAGPDVAELRRMYIDPQFRRRGLGRELLAHAESETRVNHPPCGAGHPPSIAVCPGWRAVCSEWGRKGQGSCPDAWCRFCLRWSPAMIW